ncbi:MAG: transporter [Rikenellaceae bacterium]
MKFLDTIANNRRPLMMLFCMVSGVVLYRPLSVVDSVTDHLIAPSLIFGMLFVTFCRVRIRELKFTWLQFAMILFQLIATPLSYFVFLPFGELIAQGAMICFLAPIAMAAVAVGALLGGRVTTIASYTLICNLVIAIAAPYYLDTFGDGECTLAQILWRVAPLLISPLVAAQLLKVVWRGAVEWIAAHSQMSFYMWLVSMLITLARTTGFVVEVRDEVPIMVGVGLALVAFVACAVQFVLGRKLGNYFGEPVAGTQSLGQKNTVLAVWLAQSFLYPVSSIAPTAYIIWQNLANSYQIFRHDRLRSKEE